MENKLKHCDYTFGLTESEWLELKELEDCDVDEGFTSKAYFWNDSNYSFIYNMNCGSEEELNYIEKQLFIELAKNTFNNTK